ncbi:Ig-like domain-containing protein [Clostridium carboxidivorans]|nr:Ig-like domain-containing protein [Clostridium carboxidivorans]
MQRRYSDALKCYSKSIELNSRNHEAYNYKGVVLSGLGNHLEALKNFENAIHIFENNIAYIANRGEELIYLGEYEKAASCFENLIEREPNNAKWYYKKGIVLDKLEAYIGASSAYKKAKELNPNYNIPYNENRNKAIARLKNMIISSISCIFIICCGIFARYILYSTGTLKPDIVNINMYTSKDVIEVNKEVEITEEHSLRPECSKNIDVSFKSSDNSIAIVDGKKSVKGLKPGTAKILAIANNKVIKEIEVKVVQPKVIDFQISNEKSEFSLGETEELRSSIKMNYDGVTKPKIQYSSTNSNVVSVDNAGIMRALGLGNAYIIAKAGEVERRILVNVIPDTNQLYENKKRLQTDNSYEIITMENIKGYKPTGLKLNWSYYDGNETICEYNLSWNRVEGVDQYNIYYRKKGETDFGTLTKIDGNENSCKFTAPSNSEIFIAAVKNNVESMHSDHVF